MPICAPDTSNLLRLKHFNIGFEAQHMCLACILAILGTHMFENCLLSVRQSSKISVCEIQLVYGQGCRGWIESVVPPLRSQDGFPIISVVVENGIKEGFVGISICLRTDEGVVEPNADLFADRVSKVGHWKNLCCVGCREVISIALFQGELHFKFTLIDR